MSPTLKRTRNALFPFSLNGNTLLRKERGEEIIKVLAKQNDLTEDQLNKILDTEGSIKFTLAKERGR